MVGKIPHIDNMLALVTLFGMRAGAIWLFTDVHGVDVAGCSSNVDRLLRACVRASSGAVDDEHPLNQRAVQGLAI